MYMFTVSVIYSRWDNNFFTDITYRYLQSKLSCDELEMSPHSLKTYARSLQPFLDSKTPTYGIIAFQVFPKPLMEIYSIYSRSISAPISFFW